MKGQNIITKLKKSGLVGRSGSGFPVWMKWQVVLKHKAKKKYIVCNGAEGEIEAFKDGYILANYPREVIDGVKIALKTIDHSSAYIYLRKDYYERFKVKLERLTKGLPVIITKKVGGYLSGEETVLCNVIEGKRAEPRIKPPYPCDSGIFGFPTLVNNLETFYHVGKIAKSEYKKTRFYSISGEVKNKGVFELPEDISIKQILKETGNYPSFDFFVQVGGGASGTVLLKKELDQKIDRLGVIIVFNLKKTNLFSLMNKWADFFLEGNCDKCAPCREGVYRIKEMVKSRKMDKKLLDDLYFVLEKTSLCPLGKGVVNPFSSLVNKLLK